MRTVLACAIGAVLSLIVSPAIAGPILDLPASTPTTAVSFLTVTGGGPSTTLTVAGSLGSDGALIVGHAAPFTSDAMYMGSFRMTVVINALGQGVSGTLLERATYPSPTGLQTLFDSLQLLDFDNPSPNLYRAAFGQRVQGTWVQGSPAQSTFVNPGSIIEARIILGGASGPEAKVFVATPTPTAALGGGAVMAIVGVAGILRRP